MTKKCSQRAPQGFSLAESLISISILSFTLLTIIGFMPSGLDNLKKAEDRAAKARIVASLVSELEAKSWFELQKGLGTDSRNIYYDRSGAVADERLDFAYVARYRLVESKGLPGSTVAQPDLLTVEIDISDTPLAPNPFTKTGPGVGERSYDVKVAHLVNSEATLGRIQTSAPVIP